MLLYTGAIVELKQLRIEVHFVESIFHIMNEIWQHLELDLIDKFTVGNQCPSF